MDFKEIYTSAMDGFYAGEDTSRQVIKAAKKRGGNSFARLAACAACAAVVTVTAVNFEQIKAFAERLFGVHYTMETEDDQTVELGVREPVDFDLDAFISSGVNYAKLSDYPGGFSHDELPMTREYTLEKNEETWFLKSYGSLWQARDELKKCGIDFISSKKLYDELDGFKAMVMYLPDDDGSLSINVESHTHMPKTKNGYKYDLNAYFSTKQVDEDIEQIVGEYDFDTTSDDKKWEKSTTSEFYKLYAAKNGTVYGIKKINEHFDYADKDIQSGWLACFVYKNGVYILTVDSGYLSYEDVPEQPCMSEEEFLQLLEEIR